MKCENYRWLIWARSQSHKARTKDTFLERKILPLLSLNVDSNGARGCVKAEKVGKFTHSRTRVKHLFERIGVRESVIREHKKGERQPRHSRLTTALPGNCTMVLQESLKGICEKTKSTLYSISRVSAVEVGLMQIISVWWLISATVLCLSVKATWEK